jgi:hypothetical protein
LFDNDRIVITRHTALLLLPQVIALQVFTPEELYPFLSGKRGQVTAPEALAAVDTWLAKLAGDFGVKVDYQRPEESGQDTVVRGVEMFDVIDSMEAARVRPATPDGKPLRIGLTALTSYMINAYQAVADYAAGSGNKALADKYSGLADKYSRELERISLIYATGKSYPLSTTSGEYDGAFGTTPANTGSALAASVVMGTENRLNEFTGRRFVHEQENIAKSESRSRQTLADNQVSVKKAEQASADKKKDFVRGKVMKNGKFVRWLTEADWANTEKANNKFVLREGKRTLEVQPSAQLSFGIPAYESTISGLRGKGIKHYLDGQFDRPLTDNEANLVVPVTEAGKLLAGGRNVEIIDPKDGARHIFPAAALAIINPAESRLPIIVEPGVSMATAEIEAGGNGCGTLFIKGKGRAQLGGVELERLVTGVDGFRIRGIPTGTTDKFGEPKLKMAVVDRNGTEVGNIELSRTGIDLMNTVEDNCYMVPTAAGNVYGLESEFKNKMKDLKVSSEESGGLRFLVAPDPSGKGTVKIGVPRLSMTRTMARNAEEGRLSFDPATSAVYWKHKDKKGAETAYRQINGGEIERVQGIPESIKPVLAVTKEPNATGFLDTYVTEDRDLRKLANGQVFNEDTKDYLWYSDLNNNGKPDRGEEKWFNVSVDDRSSPKAESMLFDGWKPVYMFGKKVNPFYLAQLSVAGRQQITQLYRDNFVLAYPAEFQEDKAAAPRIEYIPNAEMSKPDVRAARGLEVYNGASLMKLDDKGNVTAYFYPHRHLGMSFVLLPSGTVHRMNPVVSEGYDKQLLYKSAEKKIIGVRDSSGKDIKRFWLVEQTDLDGSLRGYVIYDAWKRVSGKVEMKGDKVALVSVSLGEKNTPEVVGAAAAKNMALQGLKGGEPVKRLYKGFDKDFNLIADDQTGWAVETGDVVGASTAKDYKVIREVDLSGNFTISRTVNSDGEEIAVISLLPPGEYYLGENTYTADGELETVVTSRAKYAAGKYEPVEKVSTFTVLTGQELQNQAAKYAEVCRYLYSVDLKKVYGFSENYGDVITALTRELKENRLAAGKLHKEKDGEFIIFRFKGDYDARILAQYSIAENVWQVNLAWDKNGEPVRSVKVWNAMIPSSAASFKLKVLDAMANGKELGSLKAEFIRAQQKANRGPVMSLDDYLKMYGISLKDNSEVVAGTTYIYDKEGKVSFKSGGEGIKESTIKYTSKVLYSYITFYYPNDPAGRPLFVKESRDGVPVFKIIMWNWSDSTHAPFGIIPGWIAVYPDRVETGVFEGATKLRGTDVYKYVVRNGNYKIAEYRTFSGSLFAEDSRIKHAPWARWLGIKDDIKTTYFDTEVPYTLAQYAKTDWERRGKADEWVSNNALPDGKSAQIVKQKNLWPKWVAGDKEPETGVRYYDKFGREIPITAEVEKLLMGNKQEGPVKQGMVYGAAASLLGLLPSGSLGLGLVIGTAFVLVMMYLPSLISHFRYQSYKKKTQGLRQTINHNAQAKLIDKESFKEGYEYMQRMVFMQNWLNPNVSRSLGGIMEVTFFTEIFVIYASVMQYAKNQQLTPADKAALLAKLDKFTVGISEYYARETARATITLEPTSDGAWRITGAGRFPMLGIPDAEINDKVKIYLYEFSERLRNALRKDNVASSAVFESAFNCYVKDYGFDSAAFKAFLKSVGFTYLHNKDENFERMISEKWRNKELLTKEEAKEALLYLCGEANATELLAMYSRSFKSFVKGRSSVIWNMSLSAVTGFGILGLGLGLPILPAVALGFALWPVLKSVISGLVLLAIVKDARALKSIYPVESRRFFGLGHGSKALHPFALEVVAFLPQFVVTSIGISLLFKTSAAPALIASISGILPLIAGVAIVSIILEYDRMANHRCLGTGEYLLTGIFGGLALALSIVSFSLPAATSAIWFLKNSLGMLFAVEAWGWLAWKHSMIGLSFYRYFKPTTGFGRGRTVILITLQIITYFALGLFMAEQSLGWFMGHFVSGIHFRGLLAQLMLFNTLYLTYYGIWAGYVALFSFLFPSKGPMKVDNAKVDEFANSMSKILINYVGPPLWSLSVFKGKGLTDEVKKGFRYLLSQNLPGTRILLDQARRVVEKSSSAPISDEDLITEIMKWVDMMHEAEKVNKVPLWDLEQIDSDILAESEPA